ncbi:MAG: hypothetical protein Q4A74_04450 [Cardiobacteriaceae bacterium]|nr:hypothetical protein [Cardiobacteriaceae bacterium]
MTLLYCTPSFGSTQGLPSNPEVSTVYPQKSGRPTCLHLLQREQHPISTLQTFAHSKKRTLLNLSEKVRLYNRNVLLKE